MADLYVAAGYVDAGYVEEIATPDAGYPSPSDVRLGVVYGPNGEYTGTYAGDSAGTIASEVVRQLNLTAIPVNIVEVNSIAVGGSGTKSDPWGPQVNFSAWRNAFGAAWGDSWGERHPPGGSVFAQMVKNDRDAEALRQRIERDDLEIIAIVVASIQAGIF